MQENKKDQKQNKEAPIYPLVVAIDPSTGAKSALGFAVFDPNTKEIITVKEMVTPAKDLRARIKELVLQLVKEFKKLDEAKIDYIVFIESTVMVGKGGESLQRIIGAIMTVVPSSKRFEHVSNMQIKAFVGGHGHAKKDQVAHGLFKFFPEDELLPGLITAHRYDALDALAVGVTGFEKYILKGEVGKKKNAKK